MARALSALATPPKVVGWSPDPDEGAAALDGGAVHTVAPDLVDAAVGVELVVLAMPLEAVAAVFRQLGPVLRPDTVVTDVASLKMPVAEAAAAHGLSTRWVGSHPLCGSERSGFAASRRLSSSSIYS